MKRTFVTLAAILALSTSAWTAPAAPPANTLTPADQNQTQLADDIIRRLRRMGFDMIKMHTGRPAEWIGKLC